MGQKWYYKEDNTDTNAFKDYLLPKEEMKYIANTSG